jgi:hypothetical protein
MSVETGASQAYSTKGPIARMAIPRFDGRLRIRPTPIRIRCNLCRATLVTRQHLLDRGVLMFSDLSQDHKFGLARGAGNTMTPDSISGEPHAAAPDWKLAVTVRTSALAGWVRPLLQTSYQDDLVSIRSVTSSLSMRFKCGPHVWD